MNIVRWAAVTVTVLFVFMNLGTAIDPEQPDWVRIAGAVLGVAGAVSAAGLALDKAWGRPAVIVVGSLNVTAAAAALLTDEGDFVPGVVVAGLGVLLGALTGSATRADLPVAVSADSPEGKQS